LSFLLKALNAQLTGTKPLQVQFFEPSIYPMGVKNALGDIKTNSDNILHGRPACDVSTPAFWQTKAVTGHPPHQQSHPKPSMPACYLKIRQRSL
jgi:hypothetical protein